MSVRDKVLAIESELNQTYFEREDQIRSMILAVLSHNHHFSLGEPGTSKSAVCRDLASRFVGATYFETILSRTRPAEAILGPLDLPKLRDTGAFQRRTHGYLPEADLAFLDEIGKSSPTLGHDLLSIMNERLYHEVKDDGTSYRTVPLATCWTASNELPTEESDDAKALWDRIVLRCKVDYIKSGGSFANMLNGNSSSECTTIPWEEIKNVGTEIIEVGVPDKITEILWDIREKLAAVQDPSNPEGVILSDRRWKSCMHILKAQAWLKGRDMVAENDLLCLKFVLWNEPSQIDTVERILIAYADRVADQVRKIGDELSDIAKGIKERKDFSREQRADHGTHQMRKMKAIRQEIIRIDSEHPGHAEIKSIKRKFKAAWIDLLETLMDQTDAAKIFDKWWTNGG